jgi:hypothetical protein
MIQALFLAAVSESRDARHLREVGLLVGGLGAAALLIGGILGFLSVRSQGRDEANAEGAAPTTRITEERLAYIIAGLLLGIGFAIQILAARTS